ncbi:MAG: D-glucuronyl C5-epimerase family protein [Flavobacteriales bacterium]
MKIIPNLFFILTIVVSCTYQNVDYNFNDKKVNSKKYKLNELNDTLSFHFTKSIADSLFYNYTPCDSSGILIKEYNGKNYYNPVQIANRALYFVSSYQNTKDTIFLKWAEKYCTKLLDLSVSNDSTILFAYQFDFALHGDSNNLMKAPWYSSMAQGHSLSLFSKMYKITNNKSYLRISEKIFNSFFLEFDEKKDDQNWLSVIDNNNYLWLEEYPFIPANYTLNGFLFSIIGLYDYYLIEKNKQAYQLLCTCIYTASKNIIYFRNKGDASSYCLSHKVKSSNYHKIHIKQFDWLYLISGDKSFRKYSKQFTKDH